MEHVLMALIQGVSIGFAGTALFLGDTYRRQGYERGFDDAMAGRPRSLYQDRPAKQPEAPRDGE